MKLLKWLSLILVLIGALNWGLIGIFNINFIALFFGSMTLMPRIIYAVVGLAGIYLLIIKFIKLLLGHYLSKL